MQQGAADLLVAVLMINHPRPSDPEWAAELEAACGGCGVVVMAPAGE